MLTTVKDEIIKIKIKDYVVHIYLMNKQHVVIGKKLVLNPR